MRNYRELRISVTFLILFLVLPILFIKTKGFNGITGNLSDFGILFMIFFTFFGIAALPLSIFHLILQFNYSKMMKKEHLIDWSYERQYWISTVLKEAIFRVKTDLLFYSKLSLKISVVLLLVFGIYYLVGDKKIIPWLILLVFTLYIVMILWCIIKNVLFVIENLILSKGLVIGTKEGLSFNGEYHYWHSKSTHRLLGVGIEDNYILIDYMVSQKENEIKRVRIPIPEEKLQEAENYARIL